MSKSLITAAVTGAMALGLIAAPAQATTAAAPLAASSTANGYGPDNTFQYYGPGREGYFLGYWYKEGGGGNSYNFGGRLVDHHADQYSATYVYFRYYDKGGNRRTKLFKTTKKRTVRDIGFKKDLDVRVCTAWHHRCGGWHDVF
ncbi:hypothetical protein LDL08_19015 [Nonomuraea glycinis]|uniref:Lactococcin 972 family bacteriocin n=1 Tax=Nonomuraea glycinis TaxID=2047744 RepID=A0A918E8Q2_9ACTN|nr:hypothetical protein [Nonomuraea glycinis]MCA2178284.1 hypothetical protein [Nonomuraea glycinis]GGP12577.1 hypothetical protein GCM10012278_60930 [Nonomuraea glycinis]